MTNLTFAALRPEYELLWDRIIAPGGLTRAGEAKKQANAILQPECRFHYQLVEERTQVPWFVTGIIQIRESGLSDEDDDGDLDPNFHAWLHNGDPMFDHRGKPRRTTHVPAGRPLNPACSWEDGAVDAYEIEGLLHKKDWSPAFVAWLLERFNGFGYRLYHHIPSPYLWGGTVVQKRGKYDRDRHFDPTVMDTQIGGMAVLAALMQMDETARFETAPTATA
jgi:lysozyme family protein